MMRQWLPLAEPEPAVVQSGMEPDELEFWCGCNLLTAYVSWGLDTFEDGLVVSTSCVERLKYEQPLEPGDKLSNRHGTKGVISRVLPDGTPVDIVCSFMSLPTRMNLGQVREAVMGRIARVEGKTAVVPPFEAPGEEVLRARLRKAGLPEDGMEQLNYRGEDLA